jgi:rhamnosyltransferase
MRSKNSDWVIGEALAALFAQDFTDFELIVLDSGSTDRTLDIVAPYPHRLVHVAPEDYFPGRVLNHGVAQAQAEIIVFQNSDAVPLTTDTLRRLVAPFEEPSVDATFARQLPRPDADTWVRRDCAASFPDAPEPPPWITLALPLAAIRKRAWQQHPFYVDAWGSEDTEWGHWAKDHGLRIVYVPDARVMHSHNYTLRQLYGRRFIEGEADAFIYRRHEGVAKMTLRIASAIARDAVACVRAGDFAELPHVPARRAVFHWAHLKGHRHGTRRRERQDRDWRTGQQTVLSRHESSRE